MWERIGCITPAIVIAEYNGRFGAHCAVTVPYENFTMRTSRGMSRTIQ
jgi:hypothetical protein